MTNTTDFGGVLTTKEARVNAGDYLLAAVKNKSEKLILGFIFI